MELLTLVLIALAAACAGALLAALVFQRRDPVQRYLWLKSRQVYSIFKHPIIPPPFPVPRSAPVPPEGFTPAAYAVVDQLACLVVRDFVEPWYQRLGASSEPPRRSHETIISAASHARARLAQCNPHEAGVDVLVILHRHLRAYNTARRDAGGEGVDGPPRSLVDLQRSYVALNAHPHAGSLDELEYLTKMAEGILASLLPASEFRVPLLRTSLARLLAVNVLLPLLDNLCDPDMLYSSLARLCSPTTVLLPEEIAARDAAQAQLNNLSSSSELASSPPTSSSAPASALAPAPTPPQPSAHALVAEAAASADMASVCAAGDCTRSLARTAMRPCPGCCQPLFCSAECQARAFVLGSHKGECSPKAASALNYPGHVSASSTPTVTGSSSGTAVVVNATASSISASNAPHHSTTSATTLSSAPTGSTPNHSTASHAPTTLTTTTTTTTIITAPADSAASLAPPGTLLTTSLPSIAVSSTSPVSNCVKLGSSATPPSFLATSLSGNVHADTVAEVSANGPRTETFVGARQGSDTAAGGSDDGDSDSSEYFSAPGMSAKQMYKAMRGHRHQPRRPVFPPSSTAPPSPTKMTAGNTAPGFFSTTSTSASLAASSAKLAASNAAKNPETIPANTSPEQLAPSAPATARAGPGGDSSEEAEQDAMPNYYMAPGVHAKQLYKAMQSQAAQRAPPRPPTLSRPPSRMSSSTAPNPVPSPSSSFTPLPPPATPAPLPRFTVAIPAFTTSDHTDYLISVRAAEPPPASNGASHVKGSLPPAAGAGDAYRSRAIAAGGAATASEDRRGSALGNAGGLSSNSSGSSPGTASVGGGLAVAGGAAVAAAGGDAAGESDGWQLCRRFSEFVKLNEILRQRYPNVMHGVHFPEKRFKNMDEALVEQRRGDLDRFLQDLVAAGLGAAPELCAFLRPDSSLFPRHAESRSSMRRMAARGLDKVTSFARTVGTMALWPFLVDRPSPAMNLPSTLEVVARTAQAADMCQPFADFLATIHHAPAPDPLLPSGPVARPGMPPCVPLLFEAGLEAFGLQHSLLSGAPARNFMQAVFGGALEIFLVWEIDTIAHPDSLARYLAVLREKFWPGGVWGPPPPARTTEDRAQTRAEALALLAAFLPPAMPVVLGRQRYMAGLRNLLNSFESPAINRHVVMALLDLVAGLLAPALATGGADDRQAAWAALGTM